MRHLRKPSEYRRVRAGVQQRKCLDCAKWLPETLEFFTAHKSKGKPGFCARCRPCNRAHREAHYVSSHNAQDGRMVAPEPLPPIPPPLMWDTLLRGLV